ncbi:MAG: AmmeMemoRadiSam system protein B [candidate division NC10 bacterium]|nr:AmmeMemoRadiSam system protein B [candidate division NC10 bacterium]
MIRRPAVAGTFYEERPDRLRSQIREFIQEDQEKEAALGAVVPHAGFFYSGKVAGAVYSRLLFPETFVILGPNHSGLGPGASIMAYGEWDMPLGPVRIHSELAQSILKASKTLKDDHMGHMREHSIEVQLPFLQYFGKAFDFVPISLYSHEFGVCQDVGSAIAEALKDYPGKIMLLASTDMSHYVPQEVAEAKDKLAIDAILNLDPKGLHETVLKNRISMCGFAPTTAVLVAAKKVGATSATLVRYMTSGEITRDHRQVVGYAGLLIQ